MLPFRVSFLEGDHAREEHYHKKATASSVGGLENLLQAANDGEVG